MTHTVYKEKTLKELYSKLIFEIKNSGLIIKNWVIKFGTT